MSNSKKRFNVDSPSFTPGVPAGPAPSSSGAGAVKNRANDVKGSPITAKSLSAVPFTPSTFTPANALGTAAQYGSKADIQLFAEAQDFMPNAFDGLQMNDSSNGAQSIAYYDSFNQGAAAGGASTVHGQVNPYAQENTLFTGATGYYQDPGLYRQPLQHHLYFPLGPHRDNLLPHQRTVHDFFISNELREELTSKASEGLQILHGSTLPDRIEHFHSLVALDRPSHGENSSFAFPNTIYKATSVNDGQVYILRRFEGYRLTSERAVRNVQAWKRIHNASIATVQDVFTTRAFGDSSLIFVTDYHPLAVTLSQHHFTNTAHQSRHGNIQTPEQVLWSYIVQISSAIKTVHAAGLAVRMIDPSKILLTSKNRIRLNACGVLDVIQYETQNSMTELQQDDLMQLGRLILCIAANDYKAMQNPDRAIGVLSRNYSAELHDCVLWLLHGPGPQNPKSIDQFLANISSHIVSNLDASLHSEDNYRSELSRELENGRLVRLLVKLGFIADRPEFEHDPQWSESGERYFLKLFRDHVFHAVDANGNPVLDLGHVLTCLNKLDVGIDERVQLESADEQTLLFVSYKELKRRLQDAFQQLVTAAQRSRV